MSFTVQILTGIFLGICVGLFFGELAAPCTVGGNIFIGLLQMTVLPYIVVSLIGNLGRITWSEGRGLLMAAMAVLAALLGLGVITLIAAPLAFPHWETASFFSASLVAPAKTFDLVSLYIPANPFRALSDNVVPAVVLFSILMGMGLSGVSGNAGLLKALDVIAEALNKINKLVIRITPIGVFLIAAGTAGTISLGELSRLQAYVITYTFIAATLSFLVLPLLVTAVTPFRYRDLLSIPRDTLITIFAAAKIIVVLPQLVDDVKELFRRYELENDEVDSGADVLMPLAYPFPNVGTYTILIFVPFSAWYLGRSLGFYDQLTFQGAALLSSFVAPIVGIPFLLDILRLPADMMELFVVSTVYTDRVRVVLGAIHMLMLTIVTLAIRRRVFRVDIARLVWTIVLSTLGLTLAILGCRAWLSFALEGSYTADTALVEIEWMDRPVVSRLLDELPPALSSEELAGSRLDAIEARGTLRVGYLRDSLPFVFRNQNGDVIGFDVEMANHLAGDLGVQLEFVQTPLSEIGELLERGQIDILMSGLALTPGRARQWSFAKAPMDLTLGFIVPDHERDRFGSLDAVRAIPGLRLGVVQSDTAFRAGLESKLPNATLISIESPRAYLRGTGPALDGVVYSAEGGSAWTLIYPRFSVAIPLPLVLKVPMAYPVPKADPEWRDFVSLWIGLKQKDGTVEALFEHWIIGSGAEESEPRWSVIRDWLHWTD